MTDVKNLQEDIKKLVKQINSKHGHERPEIISYMKVIEEIGEITEVLLSSEIKSRKGHKRQKEDIKDELGGELADAIIALMSLANDFDIDVSKFIKQKMKNHYDRIEKF